jgi:hypothetical protein
MTKKKRPTPIDRDRVIDKEKIVKRQNDDIAKVDRLVLRSSSHVKKMDACEYTQPIPGFSVIKNSADLKLVKTYADQKRIKLTYKYVKKMTKIVANVPIFNNVFDFRPHHKRYVYMVFISTLLRSHNEWMLESLIDWSEQCVEYIKTLIPK